MIFITGDNPTAIPRDCLAVAFQPISRIVCGRTRQFRQAMLKLVLNCLPSVSHMQVLGLDLGIASCGWAVTKLEDADPHLVCAGVRCFDAPLVDKTGEPKSAQRRAARGQRRVIRRRAQRMNALRAVLTDRMEQETPWRRRPGAFARASEIPGVCVHARWIVSCRTMNLPSCSVTSPATAVSAPTPNATQAPTRLTKPQK
jgi:hypothetical protein